MADFCSQCSLKMFDRDFHELAGVTSPEAWAQGKAAVVICEGCGPVQVDPEGRCVSDDCPNKHGAP